jgi:anti-anti-sigma factor
MRTHSLGDTLLVNEFDNFSGPCASMVRDLVRATLKPDHKYVEIDLKNSRFVDSEGLSALISLHKTVVQRDGAVRIRNASPMVRDLFQLTHLDTLFEFVPAA